jgi:hypothetical protein
MEYAMTRDQAIWALFSGVASQMTFKKYFCPFSLHGAHLSMCSCMLLFLYSSYVLSVKYDWSKLAKPIYKSRKGAKFSTWVSTLAGYLSSKVPHFIVSLADFFLCSQIQEEKARCLFECSRGVIRNDSHVALYLLPFVIVQALVEGGEGDNQEVLSTNYSLPPLFNFYL